MSGVLRVGEGGVSRPQPTSGLVWGMQCRGVGRKRWGRGSTDATRLPRLATPLAVMLLYSSKSVELMLHVCPRRTMVFV